MADENVPRDGAESNITPFLFEGETLIRVIMKGGEPWFVAADVCRVLSIKNPRDAVSSLDEDEKGVAITDTLGGQQEMLTVSESGLYALIFRSRKPAAVRFRKWVTSEVLPSIRKTGGYTARIATPPAPESLEPPPDTTENDNLKLRKVTVVRDIFGNRPARQMYLKLGLETVPAMFEAMRQGDMFEIEDEQGDMFGKPAKPNGNGGHGPGRA